MARRRRKFDIFSMSFLDTICCAFVAIVLLYMILNAAGSRVFQKDTSQLRAEVDKLEEEVLEGYSDLVVLRNSLRRTETDAERTEGLSDRVIDETERLRQQLAEAEKSTVSRREAIEKLKADLRQAEESQKRLEAGTPAPGKPGNRVKGFVGSGDRQYLSGLKLGGERIAVLVDVSASMLDETVVNVIRLRNMPESRRLAAEKWRRTVATVDWITAQIPAKSRFQVIAFNTRAWAVVPNSTGRWIDGSDAQALTEVVANLRRTVPADGTSLENAFALMNTLTPAPDNVFIVTDGLPTQGATPPLVKKTVDGDDRLKLFERALAKYPNRVPANVILMPMEGDPAAPGAYWTLARRTNGAFLMPARDWP
ncbi:MAG: VWA domain-containing protein [Steroidobacteraceae bacterium]